MKPVGRICGLRYKKRITHARHFTDRRLHLAVAAAIRFHTAASGVSAVFRHTVAHHIICYSQLGHRDVPRVVAMHERQPAAYHNDKRRENDYIEYDA